MSPFKKEKIIVFLLLLFLPLLYSCEKIDKALNESPYQYNLSHSFHLHDCSCIETEIILGFDKEEGVREARQKQARIIFAIDLILKSYKGEQMLDKEKRMQKIIRRAGEALLETPLKSISLVNYKVKLGNQETYDTEKAEKDKMKKPRTFHGN